MHGVDLTAIATVADLNGLIDDVNQEIARRESEDRERILRKLEEVAERYGKTIEAFLNLPRPATAAAKRPRPRPKKPTFEEATEPLRAAAHGGQPQGATGSSAAVPG